jgi:hypothetical protein
MEAEPVPQAKLRATIKAKKVDGIKSLNVLAQAQGRTCTGVQAAQQQAHRDGRIAVQVVVSQVLLPNVRHIIPN